MALVTYESVASSAEAIQQAGGKPSVRSVISHLGGGSPNAVGPLLAQWRAGRPLVRASDIELDPRIAQLIAEQVQKAAGDAARAAEDRAAIVQEDAEAVAEAGRAAEAEAALLSGQLAATQEELERIANDLTRMREQSERDGKACAEREAALKAEAENERKRGDQVAAQLAKAEVRLEAIPGLHDELERVRAALEDAQAGRQHAERAAAVATAHFEDAQRRAADLEAREKAAIARASEAEKAAQAAMQAEKTARVAEQAAQARLEGAEREISTAREAVKAERAEVRQLQEVVAELRAQTSAAKK